CLAVVRRRTRGLDQLHALFPDDAARRLWLRALVGIAPEPATAVARPHRSARPLARVPSDRPQRDPLEPHFARRPFGPHSSFARSLHRRALSPALFHRAAAAKMVPSARTRSLAVALVRPLKSRLVSGAFQLPVSA